MAVSLAPIRWPALNGSSLNTFDAIHLCQCVCLAWPSCVNISMIFYVHMALSTFSTRLSRAAQPVAILNTINQSNKTTIERYFCVQDIVSSLSTYMFSAGFNDDLSPPYRPRHYRSSLFLITSLMQN